ncbi:hypothetical protein [Psychroflexus tropicus]|uniref:hypothetical protein n=1 Tax=Psychroflexus tropicus TaxID=197345 RepID=UPI0003775402|nr:hypothetical protein [Psychroflexus tropicus]
MNSTGKTLLIQFKKQWQLLLWLEVVLFAIGFFLLIGFLSGNWLWSGLFGIIISVAVLLVKKPWKIDLQKVSKHIDHNSNQLEFSTGLLLHQAEELSGVAQLQQQKISKILSTEIKNIKPKHHLGAALLTAILLAGVGYLGFYTGVTNNSGLKPTKDPNSGSINFIPTDSSAIEVDKPVLNSQEVTITYPPYTNLPKKTASRMNIKAVEGSTVSWNLNFNGPIDSVSLESTGGVKPLQKKGSLYKGSTVLENSGFYNFKFKDSTGRTYISDLYAIEVLTDQSPVIRIQDLKQFTSFDFNEDKNLNLNSIITDDFGINKAYIIATVSKGSGESVKFREEQLQFDTRIVKGKKELRLKKLIHLDSMNMGPGDELYFYVEAKDNRFPKANRSRSQTYFAVIKDTTDYGMGVETGMGVDLMPDYFRSQRQLIIDTKKLISQRGKIPTQKFNSTSNELGFDQKSLRLKYGQFMGDEAEGSISQTESSTMGEDHDHGEDPLEGYTHDHDSENEHNLVEETHDHDHDHDDETAGGENSIENYMHNHGDPESATLFTDNLKAKLRRALNIMWDAELHLRLNEPEQSLPYQYEALELIQDIKNSARIYVHRIGFDPPPIKEEARLSGDLENVNTMRKQETIETTDNFTYIKTSIKRLEILKRSDLKISEADRSLFQKAREELSQQAIENPGRYLTTLQELKKLTELQNIKVELVREVQKGLLKSIPQQTPEPQKTSQFYGELDVTIMKALE